MAKTNYKKILEEILEDNGVTLPENEVKPALVYVEQWYLDLLSDKKSAKALGITPKEYAMGGIGNGILDGIHMDEYEEEEEDEAGDQEFIEVSQEELKKALKILTTQENSLLANLYDRWEEYNQQYFFGQLSHPLITIEKMDNRTLGNFTSGADEMGITNHIRFNRDFIALNTEERILETVRHEMIHQWQDEVYYEGEHTDGEVTLPVGFGKFLEKKNPVEVQRNADGSPIGEKADQKARPKDWHNRDFKEYAVVVNIPAKGEPCYGNPAIMPEGKSYNRKFQCKCIASNGHRVSVWCTRQLDMTCNRCKSKLIEVSKDRSSKTMKVTSHVELKGEDAIQKEMTAKGFENFKTFKSRKELVHYLDSIEAMEVSPKHESGAYQVGHNMYKKGFTHWLAYNGEIVLLPVEVPKKPVAKKKKSGKKLPKRVEKKAKVEEPKPVVVVEPEPVVEEPKPEPKKKAPAKKEPAKKKAPAKKAPAKKAPAVKPEKEQEPVDKVVDTVDNVVSIAPKLEAKAKDAERSHKNAEDLLAVYKEKGSVKGVAEFFGMTAPNIIYYAKKLGVNFKQGVIEDVKK